MFPTEMEIQMHRADMEREAAHHRLAQIAQGETEHPTLWARLRDRMIAIEQQPASEAAPRKKVVTA